MSDLWQVRMAIRCWNRFDHSYQQQDVPQALAALSMDDLHDPNWHPDTGATAHIKSEGGKNISFHT